MFTWLRSRRREALLRQAFPADWLAILSRDVAHYRVLNESQRSAVRECVQVLVAELHWEGAKRAGRDRPDCASSSPAGRRALDAPRPARLFSPGVVGDFVPRRVPAAGPRGRARPRRGGVVGRGERPRAGGAVVAGRARRGGRPGDGVPPGRPRIRAPTRLPERRGERHAAARRARRSRGVARGVRAGARAPLGPSWRRAARAISARTPPTRWSFFADCCEAFSSRRLRICSRRSRGFTGCWRHTSASSRRGGNSGRGEVALTPIGIEPSPEQPLPPAPSPKRRGGATRTGLPATSGVFKTSPRPGNLNLVPPLSVSGRGRGEGLLGPFRAGRDAADSWLNLMPMG